MYGEGYRLKPQLFWDFADSVYQGSIFFPGNKARHNHTQTVLKTMEVHKK